MLNQSLSFFRASELLLLSTWPTSEGFWVEHDMQCWSEASSVAIYLTFSALGGYFPPRPANWLPLITYKSYICFLCTKRQQTTCCWPIAINDLDISFIGFSSKQHFQEAQNFLGSTLNKPEIVFLQRKYYAQNFIPEKEKFIYFRLRLFPKTWWMNVSLLKGTHHPCFQITIIFGKDLHRHCLQWLPNNLNCPNEQLSPIPRPHKFELPLQLWEG